MTARRRAALVAVPLLLVAAVVAAVLLLRGGSERAPRAATDEPLAYVPAAAQVVLDVDTGSPLVGLAVSELAPRLSGGALSAAQVRGLLGGRAVVALVGDRPQLSLVAPDADAVTVLARRLRPTGASYRGARLFSSAGAAIAVRGATVVAAPDLAAVRGALDRRAQPAARTARAAFDRRFAGLPSTSAARVAFAAGPLLARASPRVAATRWGRSLLGGAAVLTSGEDGLRIPFRVAADPAGLRPGDLPIATGPRPPRARGGAPLSVGLRTLAQAAGFGRQAGVAVLGLLDALPGFLRPDVGGLTADATVLSADLRHVTARTEPRDAGDWSSKLGRLSALSGLAGAAGLTDASIDEHGGVYDVSQGGELLARAGVFGPALVVSDDPRADLRAAAGAPAGAAVPGAAGALTARLTAPAVRQLASERFALPAFALAALGEATGWARAELNGLSGELRLRLLGPTP
jgi:hypothetical protein